MSDFLAFDDPFWRNPNYGAIFQQRADALARIRKAPDALRPLNEFYRDHPAEFINDWGFTYDPRLVNEGKPGIIPMLLFPRQVEFINWLRWMWQNNKKGGADKSRDVGMTWLCVAFAIWLCRFHQDVAVGMGSYVQDKVDRSDDASSIFWKARMFVSMLPVEFTGNYDRRLDSKLMRINFRDTNGSIIGEVGDNIGRGGRTSWYLVDEYAHVMRPKLVDAALSQNTNSRIDISTVKGMANPFAERRHKLAPELWFSFHWRDDPRKDQAWYVKQQEELDPVTLAQEVDMDYHASVTGVVIPSAWVQAAMDAHIRLGIEPTGRRFGALDIADEGTDTNAFCGGHGIIIEHIEQWSGVGSDIFGTVQRAFGLCDDGGYDHFRYDADGLGAGARGDARIINEQRQGEGMAQISVEAFRASEAVINPEREDFKGRKNKDYFSNRKAQAWFGLRKRFQATYRAIQRLDGAADDDAPIAAHDEMISISSTAADATTLQKLRSELSQPTYSTNTIGKMIIDKAPDGARSPNLADGVMIRFAGPGVVAMKIQPMTTALRRAPMRIARR